MAKKRDLFCCLLPLTIFSRSFPASLPDCLRQIRTGRGPSVRTNLLSHDAKMPGRSQMQSNHILAKLNPVKNI